MTGSRETFAVITIVVLTAILLISLCCRELTCEEKGGVMRENRCGDSYR